MNLSVGVSKSDALNAQFEKLKKKVSKRKLVKALQAGGEVFKQAIEERTPVRTPAMSGDALPPGRLKGDINIKTIQGRGEHSAGVKVGPSSETELVMRLVEFGHVVAEQKGGSFKSKVVRAGIRYAVKRVPPHPIMRPAWEASQQQSMQAVLDVLQNDDEG